MVSAGQYQGQDVSPGDRMKRYFDLFLAVAALIALFPVFAGVALLIRASGPGPVFFAHPRIGRAAQTFGCLKFRTMAVNGDELLAACLAHDPAKAREWAETRKLRDDPRVTPIGAVLRKYSVDELPQIVNVLKGEMSIVGPRPVVRDELEMYRRGKAAYLSVRPGLTGLWQVSGRSDTSYRRRIALDGHYARHRSLAMDMAIVVKTIPAVLRSRGSY